MSDDKPMGFKDLLRDAVESASESKLYPSHDGSKIELTGKGVELPDLFLTVEVVDLNGTTEEDIPPHNAVQISVKGSF